MTTKHIRPGKNPNDIYKTPLTDNQKYGWDLTLKQNEDLSWAKTERHPHRNSPMTKFVDEMSLTNREFSLF